MMRTGRPMVVLLFGHLLTGTMPIPADETRSSSRATDPVVAVQGTWKLQTVEWLGLEAEEGDPRPDNRLAEEKCLPDFDREGRPFVIFHGNRFRFRTRLHTLDGLALYIDSEGTFTIDGGKTPHVLELCVDAETSYWETGRIKRSKAQGHLRAICRVVGHKMQWCFRAPQADPLPTRFWTDEDTGEDVFLFTFLKNES